MICFYDDDNIIFIKKTTTPYNDICPICLDQLLFLESSPEENEIEEKMIILRCGHGYHKNCIYHMLDYGEEKCGICRKTIVFQQHSFFIMIFFSFCRGLFSSHEKILLFCLTLYFSFTGFFFLFLVSNCVKLSSSQQQRQHDMNTTNLSCIECLRQLFNNSRIDP